MEDRHLCAPTGRTEGTRSTVLWGKNVAESAGQTPGHSFLPSKPQVAATVTNLAGKRGTTTHKAAHLLP